MEIADRARELAAKLQMERDLATFPDRPLQVFGICTHATMDAVHKFLYEISGPITVPATHVVEGEVISETPLPVKKVVKRRKVKRAS